MRIIDHWGEPVSAAATTTKEEPAKPAGMSGYEGAQTTDVRDSFLAFPTNSRRELNSYTRREIQRKERALTANLPIYQRIKTKIGQHAVGRGIFVSPMTEDQEWNELNLERYQRRAENPFSYSIDSSRDLYEDQRIAAESLVGDGEYFAAMVYGEAGAPMIQALDPFECETPRKLMELQKDARWQDGVLTNAFDRPIAYAIREMELGDRWFPRGEKAREVPADSMIHIFRRRRAHQTRGLPWAFNNIDDGIDALDLKALLKGKAKLHSALAIAVTNKEGSVGSGTGLADHLKKHLGADGKVAQVDERFWKGATVKYLAQGESIELLNSTCPGESVLGFIEMIYREIAIGTGLPYEVVCNLGSLGGASLRAVLEDAQWFFEMIQDTIVWRHSHRHYVWDTAVAIKRGEIRPCKDPRWWSAAYRGPAKLTVDMGRTADASIKLMKNGALSHPRYFEERAQDARQEMRDQIKFLAWMKKEAEKEGVPITWLLEPTPGAVTNISVPPNDPNA